MVVGENVAVFAEDDAGTFAGPRDQPVQPERFVRVGLVAAENGLQCAGVNTHHGRRGTVHGVRVGLQAWRLGGCGLGRTQAFFQCRPKVNDHESERQPGDDSARHEGQGVVQAGHLLILSVNPLFNIASFG